MTDTNEKKLNTIWSWFNGNGNPGAKDRLLVLEKVAIGKEDSSSMTKIKEHLNWHEKMSGRRWELYIGFLLVIASNVIIFMLSRTGG